MELIFAAYVKSVNPLIHGKPRVKKDELSEILANEDKVFKSLQAIYDLEKRASLLNVEESKLLNQIKCFYHGRLWTYLWNNWAQRIGLYS